MKVIIEYDYEDLDLALRAVQLPGLLRDLIEFDRQLRTIWKYEEHGPEATRVVEHIRDMWLDTWEDYRGET